MEVTTRHIVTVRLSNMKPQEASNISQSIQGESLMYTGHLDKPTSKKETTDKKREINIKLQVIKAVPFGDKYLPKDIEVINPNKGKKIKSKYIFIFSFLTN